MGPPGLGQRSWKLPSGPCSGGPLGGLSLTLSLADVSALAFRFVPVRFAVFLIKLLRSLKKKKKTPETKQGGTKEQMKNDTTE